MNERYSASGLRTLLTFVVAMLCFVFRGTHTIAQPAVPETGAPGYTYTVFYENLAPYGQWIEDGHYGYVWSPNVDGGFRPYFTNGHWAMTQYGNTWMSDYIWGWACFHYGRWLFDDYYGWLWLPGQDWGAAWVMWRTGAGFFGWAPLSPNYTFKENLGADNYAPPGDWWVFLPPQYLFKGNYYSYWSGPTGNSSLIKTTTQLNNFYQNNGVTYVTGPYNKQIEKASKKPVEVFSLGSSANLTTKTHHDEIKMFRPSSIEALSVYGKSPVPPGVISAPRPISEKLRAISSQLGTNTAPFRNDLVHGTLPQAGSHPVQTQKAPQSPDPTPYDWKNPEHNVSPSSVDYRVAPVMHPDHGPVQQSDSLPKARDPNPKKIPAASVQTPDPVRPDDIRTRK
jgi:hypothetical protein